MLEVKGLKKIYKTKKGATVHALDGVSLQFPDRGMIFLLGKSGSGKSTLLNVCGGLDSPTEGEIIVKGKSSKDFSQSDFDSYRNTYIGFIFQEYNILNEFTVEDNIALALELQGKPKDKKAINALLEEVDLKGYAKRKPNTLSGGQKQRIAIARALVKSPEIIMADEPTGALDSNTGRQVLETLKKLSETKLVIVVSHDRDFAEQYGDRIIELKDGKVLSDLTKTALEEQKLSDNINTVGEVLCINNGEELNESDFDKIKAFLKRSRNKIIIASDEKDVESFKKVNRINDEGQKEVFAETEGDKIERKLYDPKQTRFIRSKLPLRHASRIGLSSIGHKPFRLTLTVILCTVAFFMFGMFSTLSFYDNELVFHRTFQDGDIKLMGLGKEYQVENISRHDGKENRYTYFESTFFPVAEYKEICDRFGDEAFGAVSGDYYLPINSSVPYWAQSSLRTVSYLPENHPFRNNIIEGKYPQNDNEIVLSKYIAECILNSGSSQDSAKNTSLNISQIIGQNLNIYDREYTVVGIYNHCEIPSKYEVLKEKNSENIILLSQFQNNLQDNLHLNAFVTENELLRFSENAKNMYGKGYEISANIVMNGFENICEFFAYYGKASSHTLSDSYYSLADGKTTPDDGEVILSRSLFYRVVFDSIMTNRELYVNDYSIDESKNEKFFELERTLDELMNGKQVISPDNKEFSYQPLSAEERKIQEKALFEMLDYFKISYNSITVSKSYYNAEPEKLTVIGIDKFSGGNELMIVSDARYDIALELMSEMNGYSFETVSKFKEDPNAVYNYIYLPFDGTKEQTESFYELYANTEVGSDDSRTVLKGASVSTLRMIDEMVEMLSKVFLWVGLAFALFAALLLSNFISVSISQKKNEIGILRAVGARSFDVFKIFFSESFFIASICIVLSWIASIVACKFINAEISAGIGVSVLVFGPLSILSLIGVALLTTVIATFLPVYRAAKKKPVESIRAL